MTEAGTPTASLEREDAKLVLLAKGARGRVGAQEGAALRDETGRTYSAANVDLPSVTLSALQLAVAQAVSAGASGCECAAVISADGAVHPAGMAALSDLGGESVPVLACSSDGSLVARLTSGCLG